MGEVLSLFDRTLAVPVRTRMMGSTRVYQNEAYDGIYEQLETQRSTLLVAATGTGKTQIFSAVARDWDGRVLILAHREELLEQARAKISELTGESVGLEQADWWAGGERIIVGSVQTLCKPRRLSRFAADPFTLIIVDEAHHAPAASYKRILAAFPGAKILGVTATPDRGDKIGLKDVFESTAYVYDIERGCRDGYLTRVKVGQVLVDKVDLSAVKTTAGDLNLGQLDAEMVKANEAVAKKCLEVCGARKTIVFTTKVATAHDLVAHFNKEADREVAVAVDGETETETRRKILAGHRRGDFQFLVNVGIATEGYDCPEVACVAIARPTKSRALYAQMAGRGLRVLPGLVENLATAEERRAAVAGSAKPDCLLLDFSGNAGRHELVSPLDILGGKTPEEVLALAKEILKQKVMNAGDAVREARAQIEAERKERAARIALLRSRVDARVEYADPFKASGKDADWKERESPRPEDIEWLLRRGFARNEIPGSHAEVKRLKGRVIYRIKAGLCTWKQERCLQRMGHDGEKMTMKQAGQFIAAYKANGWSPLKPDFVARVLSGAREPGAEG